MQNSHFLLGFGLESEIRGFTWRNLKPRDRSLRRADSKLWLKWRKFVKRRFTGTRLQPNCSKYWRNRWKSNCSPGSSRNRRDPEECRNWFSHWCIAKSLDKCPCSLILETYSGSPDYRHSDDVHGNREQHHYKDSHAATKTTHEVLPARNVQLIIHLFYVFPLNIRRLFGSEQSQREFLFEKHFFRHHVFQSPATNEVQKVET